ncbi:hypothetical protein ACGFYF_39150 [Streptomyces lavendulae]|uniref:hypothetical protein n=1 Tax=Streptomyces lavendulae TaxID=1914 RepID=UPI00371E7CC0
MTGSQVDTLELGLQVELAERVPCRLRPFTNDDIATLYTRSGADRTMITLTARCTAAPCIAYGAGQDTHDALTSDEPSDRAGAGPALRHVLDQVHAQLAQLQPPRPADPAAREALWAHRAGVFREALRYLAEHARRREPLLEPLADAVLATLRRAGPRGYDPQQGGTRALLSAPQSEPYAEYRRRARALSDALRELAEQVEAHAAPAPTCVAEPEGEALDLPADPELLRCFLLQTLSTGLLISNEAAERLLGAHEDHVRAAAAAGDPASGPDR